MNFITTSWDDGHELDFKLADKLKKYNLQGTFYIPRQNRERPVMNAVQVQELSKHFEVGGHTLNHTRLYSEEPHVMEKEIYGSFRWLKGLLGNDPVCFCFPGGVCSGSASAIVFRCGFKVARSTELFCTSMPSGQKPMSTTLQVYEHTRSEYARHLLKRNRWSHLIKWMCLHSRVKLPRLAEQYLNEAGKHNGCFHLWGHSWEIEEFGLWQKLEDILKILGERNDFIRIQNRQLVQYLPQ